MKQLMENWRKFVADAEVEEAKNKDGKEQGSDGKACWDGYRHAGTGEDGKDKCVPMEEAGGKMMPPDEKEQRIRDVVRMGSHDNIEGQMLDLFSASIIVKVLDALNDNNKQRFLSIPIADMAEMSLKMMKKRGISETSCSDDDEEQLEEKPAKGKKSSKTVTNPETGRKKKVSYGQKGSKISPGTSKGDSYCARSFGIKKRLSKDKQNDPNTPNNLSRKKWKCKGEKSTK